MAHEEHLARLREGVEAWNAWRDRNPALEPDLSGADLTGKILHRANLAGANLSKVTLHDAGLSGADLAWVTLHQANIEDADLSGANLTGAQLFLANLTNANLAGANLTEANLSGATLTGADLPEAILTETDLTRVDLSYATLTKATFHKATIGWTVLGDIDLSTVRELDTVVHKGPSIIGIDTLYRSHGQIPEVFLRGAGVPDEMITYMKSLVGHPFEFYSGFISYSTKDQEFAERLHADLQNKGVRCWFAVDGVLPRGPTAAPERSC